MWLERFIIIPASLHRDFMPSAWGLYTPSLGDWGMFLGTIGLFIFLMFLFVRFVPMISMSEMKDLLHRTKAHEPVDEFGHTLHVIPDATESAPVD
jgi:molybdopterin-containing oxidoreductase family membrane subunit